MDEAERHRLRLFTIALASLMDLVLHRSEDPLADRDFVRLACRRVLADLDAEEAAQAEAEASRTRH